MKMMQHVWTKITTMILGVLLSMVTFAQDNAKVDINVNKGGGSNWYAQPWVWIVGAAIFILLLVALLRGNSSSE